MSNSHAGEAPLVLNILTATWVVLRCYPITSLTSLIIIRFLLRRYLSPLRKYPGPFLASGSRLYSVALTWRGKSHDEYPALHKKYGPIVRIQPNQLSFSSPEAAHQVLAAGKGFNKSDFYWVFPPAGNPDIFTEIREDVHAQKKRFVSQPYSMASMKALSPWIDETIESLLQKFDKMCCKSNSASESSIDLGEYLHYFAFDVLGQVAFSKPFGFVEQGRDVDNTISFIDSVQTFDNIVGQIPFIDYFLRRSPYWEYLPFVTPIGNNHVTRTALSEMAAKENGTAKIDRRDLLSMLLEAHHKDPGKFDKNTVFAVAHGAIFAGADSTASTMQTFWWNVLRGKDIYRKLCDEILNATKRGDIDDDIVSFEAAQTHLPYFQACLKEAMRVGPAVGSPMYRKVPALGADIDGTFIPGGTVVAVNAWVLHMDHEIFGTDANHFRPERWLVDDSGDMAEAEARIKRMDRYMFQFGGGSHLCIGRNLALLEMNKVIPNLVRRYDFELVHPERHMKKHSRFFVAQEGLEVRMSRREASQSTELV